MAKLYFHYSTMNAGKSTILLQASHNYRERGMQTFLLTAAFDDRSGTGRIGSRIGIGAEAETFTPQDNLFDRLQKRLNDGPCACVFLDEAQFLTRDQVWQLARAVDDLTLRFAGRDIVLVAHMGVIMTQIQRASGSTAYQALGHQIDNLSVTRMARNGAGWTLGAVNHLP